MSRRRQNLRFEMKAPCDNCPFRREGGIRLKQDRVREIVNALDAGKTFECHKTAHAGRRKVAHQHCAGALILSEKLPFQTTIYQLATRFGILNADTLRDKAEVFDSLEEMLSVQYD